MILFPAALLVPRSILYLETGPAAHQGSQFQDQVVPEVCGAGALLPLRVAHLLQAVAHPARAHGASPPPPPPPQRWLCRLPLSHPRSGLSQRPVSRGKPPGPFQPQHPLILVAGVFTLGLSHECSCTGAWLFPVTPVTWTQL